MHRIFAFNSLVDKKKTQTILKRTFVAIEIYFTDIAFFLSRLISRCYSLHVVGQTIRFVLICTKHALQKLSLPLQSISEKVA